MYKYYFGAFGNRSFIRPQFEILEDGSLREVGDNRWVEFPNGGTVSLSFSDSDTYDIKNRLLKFKIDFNRAAKIMDQLFAAGVVGPEEGTKPRKVLMTMEEFEELIK